MRTGIFGGSFDPIHYGHLIVADVAREAASLDRVLFVPTATSPLKPDGPVATARQRTEMIRLAIGGTTGFEMSDTELTRKGTSYTVDTLREIHNLHPDDELFLIMGSDLLQSFGQWKLPREICTLATPLVAARHGSSPDLGQFQDFADSQRLAEIRKWAFQFARVEISGTELRQRVAEGRSIRFRLPRGVECYIEHTGLYRDPQVSEKA